MEGGNLLSRNKSTNKSIKRLLFPGYEGVAWDQKLS